MQIGAPVELARLLLGVQRQGHSVRRLVEVQIYLCLVDGLDLVEPDRLHEDGRAELELGPPGVPGHDVPGSHEPERRARAGLTNRHCRGVMALTNDDNTNLAIAIAARLLAPRLPALCRAEHAETVANMASFGTRHIINPFEK